MPLPIFPLLPHHTLTQSSSTSPTLLAPPLQLLLLLLWRTASHEHASLVAWEEVSVQIVDKPNLFVADDPFWSCSRLWLCRLLQKNQNATFSAGYIQGLRKCKQPKPNNLHYILLWRLKTVVKVIVNLLLGKTGSPLNEHFQYMLKSNLIQELKLVSRRFGLINLVV